MSAKGPRRRTPHVPLPIQHALRVVADDLVVWRKLRGLTQLQLADRADISLNTVRRMESAEGGVAFENFLRILRALGVLESIPNALDPYNTDVGRLRSEEHLPERVRPKNLMRSDD